MAHNYVESVKECCIMNDIFVNAPTLNRSQAQFEQDYEQLLTTYGKSSKVIASMFRQAYTYNIPVRDVPAIISERFYATKEQVGNLTAKEVGDFLKEHPAIMATSHINGKVNTFLPFQLAGVACLVKGARGEEPEVDEFPIKDGKDIEIISRLAYLWCYSPSAYKEVLEGGEIK